MATATPRSLKDLSGKWTMSRGKDGLSDDIGPLLALQGFSALFRAVTARAPVYITARQLSPAAVELKQTTTASIPGVTEIWAHDWEWREVPDKLLGGMRKRSRWVKAGQVEDGEEFLTEGLDDDEEVIEAEVESLEKGWKAKQVWRMDGENYVRRVVSIKGDQKVFTKLVYVPQE